MPDKILGTKRHCQSCSENYYDLNKSPIICPHCKSEFDPEILLKSRSAKPIIAPNKKTEKPDNDNNAPDNVSNNITDNIPENIDDDNDILDDNTDLSVIAPQNDENQMPEDDNTIQEQIPPTEIEEH